MANITYVPVKRGGGEPLSWEFLAQISNMTVEEYKADHNRIYGSYGFECRPFAEGIECPFGVRDLMHDTCYLGNEEHKCKFFKRYVHGGEHDGTIECCCTKPKIIFGGKKVVQLSLF